MKSIHNQGIYRILNTVIGYGYCKLICKNGHYKTATPCKECAKEIQKRFRERHP